MSSPPAPQTGFLARFGGILVHPQRTLASVIEAPGGTTNAVTVAALVVGLLASPIGSARAILLIPVTFLGGLSNLVTVLAGSVLWEVIALSLLASVLAASARKRDPAVDSEGVHAAVMLTFVPYLALLLLGAFLDQSGLDRTLGAWTDVLPHRSWRAALHGRGFDGWVAAKLAVAYGPTLFLLGWLTQRVTRPGGSGEGRTGDGRSGRDDGRQPDAPKTSRKNKR